MDLGFTSRKIEFKVKKLDKITFKKSGEDNKRNKGRKKGRKKGRQEGRKGEMFPQTLC